MRRSILKSTSAGQNLLLGLTPTRLQLTRGGAREGREQRGAGHGPGRQGARRCLRMKGGTAGGGAACGGDAEWGAAAEGANTVSVLLRWVPARAGTEPSPRSSGTWLCRAALRRSVPPGPLHAACLLGRIQSRHLCGMEGPTCIGAPSRPCWRGFCASWGF